MKARLTLLAVVIAATGCTVSVDPGTTPTPTPAPRANARPAGEAPYARDLFGPAWKDVDGNGCNQRDDVLYRDVRPDSVVVQRQGRCDHDVMSGTWLDPYTGNVITLTNAKTQANRVQIDHIVALKEAYVSGASAWTPEKRLAYANDTSNLIAVGGSVNASKSDQDAAEWQPIESFQCTFAARYISTKLKWDLTIDAKENAALRKMLAGC